MIKKQLNISQKNAVEYIDGPLIIIAGAGTGKTTVITQKIKFLIDNKFATPDQILALTFNEKAATELQNRVDEMMDIGYLDMQISTFHAFCQHLLEQFALDIGLPNRFKLLTQTDAWMLVRKNLDKFNLDYYKPLGSPTRYIHEMIKHFLKCKDELISPEKYLSHAENTKLDKDQANLDEKNRLIEISNSYHIYNQLLLDNNSLDFSDLIYYVNLLLDKRSTILSQLQKKFKYILVDEFQDVNWSQYQLIKKLSVAGSQLTVVGDDDQSIYAFRGASVANILRFKDDFPTAKEIVLNDNYRSEQKILDKSYQLIQNNNPDRLETRLHINKKLLSQQNIKNDNSVIHRYFDSVEEEARFIASEIIKLKNEDEEAVWDDFAILIRANNHAEPFINLFEKQKIPYEFMAASGLFRQPIVIDCINFLKLIDNYHESASVYRLLRMPFIQFDETEMQKLTYFAQMKSVSYYEAMLRLSEIKLSESGTSAINKLLTLIDEGCKNKKNDKPTSVIYKFLDASGYLKYLTEGEVDMDRFIIRQIYHLNQFFEYISKYESMVEGVSVADFLEHFNQTVDSGDHGVIKQPKDTPDSVNICTVHTAKGLEYKYVFVVNLVEDRFPLRKKGDGIEIPNELINEKLPEGDSHYNEERRLFYVAMTRAKKILYLTSAKNYGGIREKKISRFLNEIEFADSKTISNNTLNLHTPKLVNTVSEKANKLVYEIPKAFSFSQLQKYEKCPYQYKLAHILKIPTAGKPSFSFGSTMHNTLEQFYSRIREINLSKQESLFAISETPKNLSSVVVPSLDELLDIYDKCWIPDWYIEKKQREAFYKKGKNILREFYDVNLNKWTIPIALETAFNIKIGSNTIKGRIDRIDLLPNGELEIIDYKTGVSKDKIVGDDKDQLLIYQIAINQLPAFTKIGITKTLTYYYLNGNIRISFLGTDKDVGKIENKINSLIQRITEHNFIPTPDRFTCEHCDFKDVCDFRMV